ncbi:type I toxin-antitoxin system Fst family toxin (plasmid) [Lactobacillus johnsonii]
MFLELIVSSIIAPIIVGIALKLFDYWLDNRKNDRKK